MLSTNFDTIIQTSYLWFPIHVSISEELRQYVNCVTLELLVLGEDLHRHYFTLHGRMQRL